ncbi:hypothetical protein XA68_18221 [Ophiocordyceps unilateralis]|uniref:Uncharacterized protein n=1 Tax=Ophiocordyceps unilateralis TaxID=268505 RepID=A0A2A9PPB5_OPHUN|nr:hypothetical protein XA68_18221 [Ophiocordyceps unilateralis]
MLPGFQDQVCDLYHYISANSYFRRSNLSSACWRSGTNMGCAGFPRKARVPSRSSGMGHQRSRKTSLPLAIRPYGKTMHIQFKYHQLTDDMRAWLGTIHQSQQPATPQLDTSAGSGESNLTTPQPSLTNCLWINTYESNEQSAGNDETFFLLAEPELLFLHHQQHPEPGLNPSHIVGNKRRQKGRLHSTTYTFKAAGRETMHDRLFQMTRELEALWQVPSRHDGVQDAIS